MLYSFRNMQYSEYMYLYLGTCPRYVSQHGLVQILLF